MTEIKEIHSKSRKRAKRMAPAERRQQLTECAVRVFSRCGLGNAGHAQVADEAGVSTPTVFLYMPNRQALIDTVLAEIERYLVYMVRTAAAGAATASQKLLAVAHAFAKAIDTDPEYVNVFLNWGAVAHEETWPQYVGFQDRILATFEAIIEQGIACREIPREVNPVWGAHLLMGSANMIAQMKFRARAQSDINGFLDALIQGILSGHRGNGSGET